MCIYNMFHIYKYLIYVYVRSEADICNGVIDEAEVWQVLRVVCNTENTTEIGRPSPCFVKRKQHRLPVEKKNQNSSCTSEEDLLLHGAKKQVRAPAPWTPSYATVRAWYIIRPRMQVEVCFFIMETSSGLYKVYTAQKLL